MSQEIAAHLKAHTNENYVVLDYSDDLLRDQWSHLILVNDENDLRILMYRNS